MNFCSANCLYRHTSIVDVDRTLSQIDAHHTYSGNVIQRQIHASTHKYYDIRYNACEAEANIQKHIPATMYADL